MRLNFAFGSQLRSWQACEPSSLQHPDGTCKEPLLSIYQIADGTYLLSKKWIMVASWLNQYLVVHVLTLSPHKDSPFNRSHPLVLFAQPYVL